MLDLSSKIDEVTADLFVLIDQVANKMGCEYLVVGATARDLVMHHGYGAPVRRATQDLDFAIQIVSWEQFETLMKQLGAHGFTKGKMPQRMMSADGIPIDLMPFGAVANDESNIHWPPSGEVEMDVTGFDDATNCADRVIIRRNPTIQIPVASTQGLTLLKLIAWSDRVANLRVKDALDLAYLIDNYERVEQVGGRIYDIDGLMAQYEWDNDLGSAHLLGVDTAAIAGPNAKARIVAIIDSNLQEETPNYLVEEMCTRLDEEYEKKLNQLSAFANGFKS